MASVDMKIIVVDTLPVSDFAPHALYLYKKTGALYGQMYKANAAGTALTLFSDRVDVNKTIIHRGIAAPTPGQSTPLWYNTEELVLYVNIPVDGSDNWVEAFAVPTMPVFGGNGVAETMSRSDHTHAGVTVQNPTW